MQLNATLKTVTELNQETKRFIIDIQQEIRENIEPVKSRTADNNYTTEI